MSHDVYVAARVPEKLREILKAQLARDTHLNTSEYVREALREKLQREAPDLFDQLVRGKKN